MRQHTQFLLTLATALVLAPTALRAQSATRPVERKPPELFRLTRTTMDVPERGPVQQMHLDSGVERITFVPPPLCDARLVAAERKVVFDRRQGIGLFSLQLNPLQIVPFEGDEKPTREQVEARWPGSRVTEEFDQPTGLGKGRSFVLNSTIPQQGQWTTRVVVVQTRTGTIELSLSCPAADTARLRPAWVNLLNTVKLETPVVAATSR